MGPYTAEQIIRIGGKEWRKHGKHRVYINAPVLRHLLDLRVEYYNTGNIKHAELRGQHISNAEARRILDSEIYWEGGVLHINSASHWHRQDILDAINDAIAATEPQQDDDQDGDTDGGQDGDASGTTEQAAAPQQTEQTATAEMAVSRLVALRQAGQTVREIAEMVGCAVSTVYRWLRGVHRPSSRYAAILAAIAA